MMKYSMILIMVLTLWINGISQSTLDLSANYETVGVTVLLDDEDPEKDAFGTLEYKIYTSSQWREGFPLSRVINELNMCSGSIFWLEPNINYDVKVILSDPTTEALDGQMLHGSISTKKYPTITTIEGTTYNVSPTGEGDFYKLQEAINLAVAGDEVLLSAGTYYVGSIAFPNNGNTDHPILVRGVSKEDVIIDGGYESPLVWTPYGNNGAYQTTTTTKDPNLVIVDGLRLYPHQTMPDMLSNKITINYLPLRAYPAEVGGFYRNPNAPFAWNIEEPSGINDKKLYIRLLDGSDPNTKDVEVSNQGRCFNIIDNQYITLKELTIKNYGLGPFTTAILISNSSNIVVESCDFKANNTSIRLSNEATEILMQNCNFKDYFFNWNSWKVKGTHDPNPPFSNVFPYNSRNLEKGSLIFGNDFTGHNIVFRGNTLRDYHQAGQISPAPPGATELDNMRKSLEIDCYDNSIIDCRGDGFEVDGFARNVRIFRNEFIGGHAPLSLAVAEEGPLYILRNTFSNIIHDYSDYAGNLLLSPGHPLKFANGTQTKRNGDIFFYHNTIDAQNAAYGMNMSQVELAHPWRHMESKNNIFITDEGIGLQVRTISGLPNFTSDYNNYDSNNEDIACLDLDNMGDDCYPFITDVFDNYGLEEHSLQEDPLFTSSSDYTLSEDSPMIDAGVIIVGINENDYNGANPDIGAFESDFSVSNIELSESKIKIFPNPTTGIVNIEIPKNGGYWHCTIYDVNGKSMYEKAIKGNNHGIDISSFPFGIYLVQLNNKDKMISEKIVKIR